MVTKKVLYVVTHTLVVTFLMTVHLELKDRWNRWFDREAWYNKNSGFRQEYCLNNGDSNAEYL
jgi:hypothetical protein